jgi:phosphoribosylaminoimidazole-succinocarboxamide synthase
MAGGALLYEDSGRRISLSDRRDRYVYEFLDGESEYDGGKIPASATKAAANLKIAAALFKLLESNGVDTHFIGETGKREMEVRATVMVPVRIACRNAATGRFAKRSGLTDGEILSGPIVEFNLLNDAISRRAPGAGMEILPEVTEGQAKIMLAKAVIANQILKDFFHERGLTLADYEYDFVRGDDFMIRVGGGICPDTCTIWDRDEHEKPDRDRFRRALRGADAAYGVVLERITGGA